MSADELIQVQPHAAQAADGRLLAKTLVDQQLLTRFQAEMLLAGRTDGFVLGQYRILEHIGKGGMGRVFKAEHLTMRRVVALKVLAPNLTKTPRAQLLFMREVRAAARLSHPNIVAAYDANQAGDRHYLVMEFVDGANLQDVVRMQGPLPVPLVCDLVRQAALGLQHACEQNMVHRDIKPANLLIQRGQVPVLKILDFGLARLSASAEGVQTPTNESILAANNAIMGTPDYLSPEQSKNVHSADIRSDLYSLGCTFYFMLTGRPPFAGGTMLEKLVRHSTEHAVPVEQLRPDVPPAVANVVRRLMAKDPAERFQSPMDLAVALSSFTPNTAHLVTQRPPGSQPIMRLPTGSQTNLRMPPPTGSQSTVRLPPGVPANQATVRQPSPPAPPAASPFANLNESGETSAGDDEAMIGTLPSDNPLTPVTNVSFIRKRRPNGYSAKTPRFRHPGSFPWLLLAGMLAVGLGIGIAVTCLMLALKVLKVG